MQLIIALSIWYILNGVAVAAFAVKATQETNWPKSVMIVFFWPIFLLFGNVL